MFDATEHAYVCVCVSVRVCVLIKLYISCKCMCVCMVLLMLDKHSLALLLAQVLSTGLPTERAKVLSFDHDNEVEILCRQYTI